MGIDWKQAGKLIKPVPSYEELIKRLLVIVSYDFVTETYNHTMEEAKEYAACLLGSDPRKRYGDYLEKLEKAFSQLDNLNVKSYSEFIHRVRSREEAEAFCSRANMALEELIRVLKFLLFWVLPTKMYLRELIDKKNQTQLKYVATMRENNIRFTLDLLEKGRTGGSREKIAEETGIPRDFIFELVNRADFTRMPYVSGKTVRHYFGAGYKSLEQLARAELNQLTREMSEYLDSMGIKLSRSFIELDSGIIIAKVLPKLVEN